MQLPVTIKGRYELRAMLGQGGMGVVYRAYDTLIRREVAFKTIRDVPSRASLELFYKECDVLASISHPNIVEIFDLGEFDEDGAGKPYFVMPLLPGVTLDALIAEGSQRLTVDRTVEILSQACRGLQAAHERGLVHRDLKPSNIFVMPDDSVKIIDFGVAHMVDARSTVGHKGTLLYMAPEQVEMKPPSPLSDIFSMGVVSYEAFTRRNPFERPSASEVALAILHQNPPPASDIVPSVNSAIGRVIHKAMAKQSWHRFSTARDFSDALQKARRNEPIELFDPARIQPRVQRARKAFELEDYQFAGEILSELEAEGYTDPAISELRSHIDHRNRQRIVSKLLENARTRIEEQEYPLALQKLQEVLQLDPSNATAMALKSGIEEKRRDQKVEDWFRIARQHLEQNSFSHAREALQNALQLKPRESMALQMLAEADRREQEYVRLRQDKERLYQQALEAWNQGEVSSALTRLEKLVELDRRAPDTAAPERALSFQNFYNQVRSEHEAIEHSYAEARRNLVDGNLSAALAICNDLLGRHPGHALFQALKFDIEERQRQGLSAAIAEIDRQVEAEPDLEKRVNILKEALARYPGESRFEGAMRLMRDKRDLVNSIVAKARMHEEREQFAEALGQWEILKTIYSQYPGLSFEIERVSRRRDQQVRIESKRRWVEEIDGLLDNSDFARARERVRNAFAEFPDDEELKGLEKLAAQGVERSAEAHQLLDHGQALWNERKFEESLDTLRRARALDGRDSAVRAALLGSLLERARAVLEEHCDQADMLIEEALSLDPDNVHAKSLRTLAQDRRRQEFVDHCVAHARHLQSTGDVETALRQVEGALENYPRDMRLQQLRTTLAKAFTEARRSSVTEAAPRKPAAERTTAEAPPAEVQPAARGPWRTMAAPPAPADRELAQTLAIEPMAETVAMPAVAMPAAAMSTAAAPKPAPVVEPAPPAPAVPLNAPGSPAARKPAGKLWIGAAAAVVALIGGGVWWSQKKASAPPPPPASPTPAAAPIAVAPGVLAQTARVVSDFDAGKVFLDGQPAGDLQEGQFALENVAPGSHILKVTGPRGEATLSFTVAAGAPAALGGITAKDVTAIAVSNMGAGGKVQTSLGPTALTLDGQMVGQAGPAGIDLNNVKPGQHQVGVGEGANQRSMVVGFADAPALNLFLQSDRDVGTLVVVAGEDDAQVFLDGKPYPRTTKRGQLRISNLAVRDYAVRIAKDGYLDEPELHTQIQKGREAKLEFKLRPVPRVAALSIQGGTPGAQVLVDGNALGTLGPDGAFSASNLQPGDHTIELRKEQFKSRKAQRHFNAGETVQIAKADASLDPAIGTLRWSVSPADARVTLARAGDSQTRIVTDATLTLPEGSYTLTARAAGYAERTASVQVAAGETKSVELQLVKEKTLLPVTAANEMADWDDSAAWMREGKWFVRKGGNLVTYKPASVAGHIAFTAGMRKGRRLQWVVNRKDDRNYALFQMDKKFFYRNQVVDGKTKQLLKVPHGLEKQDFFTLELEVKPGSIVHRLQDGDKWITLDNWTEPGYDFPNGKFGFLIPGSDQMALSNFRYTP